MFKRSRLPLPGARPSGILRRSSRRRQLPWRALLILLALILLGAGLFWLWNRPALTLVINGDPRTLRSYRGDVAGVLRAAGFEAGEWLALYPPPETPVRPGMVIGLTRPGELLAQVDGSLRRLDSLSLDPAESLAAAGISLAPADRVEVLRSLGPDLNRYPELAALPALPREIVLHRARTLIVEEGGAQVSFSSSAPTLLAALHEAGFTLYQGDVLNLPPASTLATLPDPILVQIRRAAPLTLQVDGLTLGLRTQAATVGEAVELLGLSLDGEDYLRPGPETPVTPGLALELTRVESRRVSVEVAVPYETLYIPDPSLELDQRRPVQSGQPGLLIREVEIREENGREVARWPAGEWLAQAPQPEIIAYGTRIVIRTLEVEGGVIEYWRTLSVLATSYSPLTADAKRPGDPGYNVTAAGAAVQRGVVAVDTRVINLYARMFIPGYGFGQALDTGGAIKGLRIDLGYDDAEFYSRYEFIQIYLLPPVPPPGQINYLIPLAEAGEE